MRMAAAPVAQEPQAELERGAVGAPRPAEARSDCVRDLDAIPAPMGGETPPLVLEVHGWRSWDTSGYMRNRPFDTVLLWRNGVNQDVPPGGWVAQEDHERVLRAVIRAKCPDREPGWPAFPEGGEVLHVTDAKAKVWLPQALRTALIHWRYRPKSPLPPQTQPPQKRRCP